MAESAARFKAWMAGAGEWSARLLFPPVCPGCRRLVVEAGALCGACWPKLRFLERPWCEVTGAPFSHEIGEGMLSADAIANPPPFARARSAVVYGGVARRLVHGLKFGDRTEHAPWMARWMMRAGAELLEEADLVVPTPLHRLRFFHRRFNQSAELARALCRLSGLPLAPRAVLRVRPTPPQSGLGARQREDNMRGAFKVPPAAEIALRGRRVLLVDDVYTTGATVFAVTRTLKRGGAAKVDVLTFARVLPGDYRDGEAHSI